MKDKKGCTRILILLLLCSISAVFCMRYTSTYTNYCIAAFLESLRFIRDRVLAWGWVGGATVVCKEKNTLNKRNKNRAKHQLDCVKLLFCMRYTSTYTNHCVAAGLEGFNASTKEKLAL